MTTRHLDPVTGIDTILPDDEWATVVVGSTDGVPVISAASERLGAFLIAHPYAKHLDWFVVDRLACLWDTHDDDTRATVSSLTQRLAGWVESMGGGE